MHLDPEPSEETPRGLHPRSAFFRDPGHVRNGHLDERPPRAYARIESGPLRVDAGRDWGSGTRPGLCNAPALACSPCREFLERRAHAFVR
jgi:hypothetical protein